MLDGDSPRVLERVAGRLGELVLRSDGRNGASERLLVRVALREP